MLRRLIIVVLLLGAAVVPVVAQEGNDIVGPEVTIDPNPEPRPRPFPVQTFESGPVTLARYFDTLNQGDVGLLQISGATQARARFLSRFVDFFPGSDGGLYALVAVGIDQTPRDYALDVTATLADGQTVTLNLLVTVGWGGFARQSFTVPPERAYLTAPEIERNEYARLESVFADPMDTPMWDTLGFQPPVSSVITSPFGAYRTLNQNTQTRHTGWDLRAVPGTPIQASASGSVAFSGPLDIRGNHVVIDHGYGVFSGYSHMSQLHVSRGQTVERGQIIGVTGNSGRSNGPHLHWEININGEWIDGVLFTEMWLP